MDSPSTDSEATDEPSQAPPGDYVPIPYKRQIVWPKVAFLLVMHSLGFAGCLYLPVIKWWTLAFAVLLSYLTALSVQVGVHRLWSHRSFQANLGFRLGLAAFYTMAFHGTIYDWVRDHRCHHKWSETDADPYNSSRGFFFSHVGWLAVRKHPEVVRKGRNIDMSDIEADPIARHQKRWYLPLVFLLWGLVPTLIPVYLWGERLTCSLFVCVFLRYVIQLNGTWLVNSWAHLYGYRPYDKRIAPVESSIRHLLYGEGFHNYHHAFPWDYSASELGPLEVFNPATALIDAAQTIGWAWGLKRAPVSLVGKRVAATGDEKLLIKGHFAREWIGGLAASSVYWIVPLAFAYSVQALHTLVP